MDFFVPLAIADAQELCSVVYLPGLLTSPALGGDAQVHSGIF
jgi:hypothetical protein